MDRFGTIRHECQRERQRFLKWFERQDGRAVSARALTCEIDETLKSVVKMVRQLEFHGDETHDLAVSRKTML